jgi:transposase
LFITAVWNQEAHQACLGMIRRHWRGWNLVLFEARGSPHMAAASLRQAKTLPIEVRFLPRSPPELNAMEHLWRHVKGRGLANRLTSSIDKAADDAWQYLLAMSCRERLQKARGLSGNFWLAT